MTPQKIKNLLETKEVDTFIQIKRIKLQQYQKLDHKFYNPLRY